MGSFHFHHGDYGWYADRDDPETVWWDGEDGVEPTEEDTEAAAQWWEEQGLNEAMHEEAEGYADFMEHYY